MQLETYLRKCSHLGMTEHEVRHDIRPGGQVVLRIKPTRIDALALDLIVQGGQLHQDPATLPPQFPDIA